MLTTASLILLLIPAFAQVSNLDLTTPPAIAKVAPASFLGLAVEWFGINRFTLAKPYSAPPPSSSVLSPVTVNAMKSLRLLSSSKKKNIIRIGGNSARDMYWLPSVAGPWSPNRVLTDEVDVFQLQILDVWASETGTQLMINIGTRFPDPNSWYTRDLLAAVKVYIKAENLHSVEIGNEPDHFVMRQVRPATYSYPDFAAEFRLYSAVVAEYFTGLAVSGPSFAYEWRDQGFNTQFIKDFSTPGTSFVKYNTIHRYDLQGCNAASTLDMLMALPDDKTYQFVTDAIGASSGGQGVIWNEGGTASCSGLDGISDAFGAALWAVDAAFEMSFRGVMAGCFSGAPQAKYGPLTFEPTTGWTIEPTYYGMLAYALAIRGDGSLIAQHSTSTAYKVWSSHNQDKKVMTLTIINKIRNGADVTVSFRPPVGYSFVKYIAMTSPGGIAAIGGSTIAGMVFDVATASFTGVYKETVVTGAAGVYSVTVPKESLIVVFASATDLGNVMSAAVEGTTPAAPGQGGFPDFSPTTSVNTRSKLIGGGGSRSRNVGYGLLFVLLGFWMSCSGLILL